MIADIRRLSERKRHGDELSSEEIHWLVDAYATSEIEDAPMAAWLMAVCCSGMTDGETWHLTEALAHSGEMLDLSEFGVRTVDKHSTGGVGDKVTLVVAPLAAACGALVPKMSGRGLGHTGGTIDKLEAIPGLNTDLSPQELLNQVREIGVGVTAQSGGLAPADGKMYALRDATGTVDSRSLIASSIMSKKLAAGAEAIVLEVTAGGGAFMETIEAARNLADLMTRLGVRAGRKVASVLVTMDTPLGLTVGNAVEVEEAARILQGDGPDDLREVSVEIAAQMLLAAQVHHGREAAHEAVAGAIASGSGFAKLVEMVEAQGGDATVLDEELCGHRPSHRGWLRAEESGVLARIDARGAGYAALEAGAGRKRKSDSVDPAAGLRFILGVGSRVERDDEIAEVMAGSPERLERALAELERAVEISDQEIEARSRIVEIVPVEAP